MTPDKRPKSEDWHREEIKAAIRMRGSSLSELATLSGYEASSFYRALSRPWPAVEAIIATALDRPPKDIWPSRYDAKGSPLGGRRQKPSRRQAPSHRQITGAA